MWQMLELSTRRGLITGLGALFLAAPAIVRAGSLMPISVRHLGPTLPPGWGDLVTVENGNIVFQIKYAIKVIEGAVELRIA
jgi:hypothetical protein